MMTCYVTFVSVDTYYMIKLGEDDDRYVAWVVPTCTPTWEGTRKQAMQYLMTHHKLGAQQADAQLGRADLRGSSDMRPGEGDWWWGEGGYAGPTGQRGWLSRSLLGEFCRLWLAGKHAAAHTLTTDL